MKEHVSTLQNIVLESPIFPLGVVCGRYAFLQEGKGRIEHGGLRLQGKYKRSTEKQPLVTYLTVVRNNCHTLEYCMESVWRQTYDNIEHIIIDGASTDGTLDIIKRHAHCIDYYISEPDKGIYNAINKALSVASGEIINILNSDDWAESDAAEAVVKKYLSTAFDFLGGAGTQYFEHGGVAYQWMPKDIKLGAAFFGMPVMHQAVYATRHCYEVAGEYDETYLSAADYKWIMTVCNKGLLTVTTDKFLANFRLGGMSSNQELDFNERLRLALEFFSCLTKEDACTLLKELHIVPLYQSLRVPGQKEHLYPIFDKYGQQAELVKAIGEALVMQRTELKKVLSQQSSSPLRIFKAIYGKKVVFFGTGSLSRRLCDYFPFPISYFVDNNPEMWRQQLNGLPIYSPERLKGEDKDNLAIIVASQYFQEIVEQLQGMGFKEKCHIWDGSVWDKLNS
ncbi:MAG: glycosyltransferase [Sporomusaceae bacterium]|nr:glycosyltransferase [Sporomusaceae bacterium]